MVARESGIERVSAAESKAARAADVDAGRPGDRTGLGAQMSAVAVAAVPPAMGMGTRRLSRDAIACRSPVPARTRSRSARVARAPAAPAHGSRAGGNREQDARRQSCAEDTRPARRPVHGHSSAPPGRVALSRPAARPHAVPRAPSGHARRPGCRTAAHRRRSGAGPHQECGERRERPRRTRAHRPGSRVCGAARDGIGCTAGGHADGAGREGAALGRQPRPAAAPRPGRTSPTGPAAGPGARRRRRGRRPRTWGRGR